ncbi:MAG TPA: alpha/beta hydrolase [Xanthobacteraceae bacterium]|nr:alpha/beta hydrolase [Xanthobacteraceae bacterium]
MSEVILFCLLALGLIVAGLAVATSIGVSRLEAAHPPAGQFVEVDDVRLHVVILEPTLEISETEPAIVLIHGASGNLEDMRIALGEKLAATHRVILIDRPGHGWSTRPKDDDCSLPSRQAELVAGALEKLKVHQAIIIGHSWGGAAAAAFALAFPDRTAGLVLLAAPTHPWPGNPGWYNKLAVLPFIGDLFLRTCVYPLGLLLIHEVSRSVFEPQAVPDNYLRRAAIQLVLRPIAFHSNARDLVLLERFIAAQVPRYVDLCVPTVIIAGDQDTLVSPEINARALAATLPGAKLVLLKGIGHMPHHAAPEAVTAAIDELIQKGRCATSTRCAA